MTTTTTPITLSASSLIGNDVRNPAGDGLGTIEEIMIDLGSGAVSFAVLEMGGFLGLGSKLFAIPWNALRLDTEHHEFVLDVDRERLENAPGFDKDNWPNFADQTWTTQVRDFWIVR